jgi:hypothetical protein
MRTIIVTALGFLMIGTGLLFQLKSTSAESRFAQVIPFGEGSGVKFFDQRDGKIYVYDNNMKFVSSYQLSDLGQPIEPVETAPKTLKFE